ncbi:MAG TPA: serine/threonine-protein kinase [Thermoanaerobaculia bacterium]|jgi:serine/threonine-protein kinase
MSQIACLNCKQTIDASYDLCPHCGDKITGLQRTYAGRLIDGKYQIIDRLGVGGMGEIFKVRHIHLNELRVIKVMRANVAAGDEGLQRFLQEARTSTMIKHKNLAMLYDFAQLEDGSYYMVWEFIDGTNIQKWIASTGAVPPRLTVEIAVQALMGLDHLHSMGLIHRDISPENIMLSQDHHGRLLVKVIDFGIAKQLSEGDGGQGLTQTGMFLGKLKYASPEQAGFLKDGEHLDPRSDLYSFGIVMYEMLAGRAPFNATNPHGYILKHVTEKPAPIGETNPGVKIPPQLEAIIMKSLEKSRDNRYETAADFASALEGIRSSIAPDQKYGVGEKMITLSGAQTLADLPKITGTAPQVTSSGAQATQQTYAGGTVPGRTMPGGGDEATRVERLSPKTIGSDEATVMERLGATAATAAEAKWSSEAAATQLEPKMTMAPKRNVALIGGIAAAAVIAVIAAIFLTQKKSDVQPADTVVSTAGTEVTTTAPTATQAPIPGNQGLLLLSASPWGELDRIVSKSDQKEIPLPADRDTPTRMQLEPGQYTLTMSGPQGQKSVDVNIRAGERHTHNVNMGDVNFDELEKELRKP